jgi:NAD(P)-dependent dehydrogenase (short-subunit alcohol dehydrogenase family)
MTPENPVVLVTGGSRGIGAAVAQLAASRGYNVAVNFRIGSRRRPSAWSQAAAQLASDARACRGDVAVEAEVLRVFEEAATLGRLTHVVNNAGRHRASKPPRCRLCRDDPRLH